MRKTSRNLSKRIDLSSQRKSYLEKQKKKQKERERADRDRATAMAPRGLCARKGVVPSWSFKARATAKVRSALSRGRHNCAADLRAGGSLARRKAPGLGRRAASEKEPVGEPVGECFLFLLRFFSYYYYYFRPRSPMKTVGSD